MIAADVVFGGALSFILGIAAASFGWNTGLLMSAALLLGFTILFSLNHLDLWKILLLFLSLIFLGIFYYSFYFNLRAEQEKIVLNQTVSFSGVIISEPRPSDKYQSLDLELKAPFRGKIRLLASPENNLRYGDLLGIEGKIEPRTSLADEPVTAFPKIQILAEHQGFWPKERLLNFKAGLLDEFPKNLPGEEAALLSGLTLGSRSNFSKDFKNQMALSGTTHLVALSGYNIAILVFAVAYALEKFLSRRKTFYLTTLVIFLFVLMVGAEASVVRAAIMGFLALFAKEAGRIYSARNAVALTALFMILVDPSVLIFNIGFQLSFLSLLGIVYLAPAIKNIFRIKENTGGLRETAIMTLSAQLAVMPVIIQAFGQFSITAILANVLILEFIPFTMFMGFLLAAISSIYFYLGFAVARIAEMLLFYEITVIKFFAKFSLPVPIPFGESFLTILYYSAMILFIYNFAPRGAQEK